MRTDDTEVTPTEIPCDDDEAHDTWPAKEPPSFISNTPPAGTTVLPPIAKAPPAPDFSNYED